MQQKHFWHHYKPNFMLNNIVKSWAKKSVSGKKNMNFFMQGTHFKIYAIVASMIKRFKPTIALKCSDQRMKYHVAVFVSNI